MFIVSASLPDAPLRVWREGWRWQRCAWEFGGVYDPLRGCWGEGVGPREGVEAKEGPCLGTGID